MSVQPFHGEKDVSQSQIVDPAEALKAAQSAAEQQLQDDGPSGGGAGGSNKDYTLADHVLSAPLGGSKFASAVRGIGIFSDAVTGGSKSNFMPGQVGPSSKFSATPLVPLTYAQKVAAVKKDNKQAGKKGPSHGLSSTKLGIARMSLTGKSGGHAKPFSLTGANCNTSMLRSLGVAAVLLNTIDTAHRALSGPMSAARINHGLSEGHHGAEMAAQQMIHKAPEMAARVLQPAGKN